MDDVLAVLDAGITALGDRPVYAVPDTVLVGAVSTIQSMINRLTAVQAIAVHEVDGRGLIRDSGAVNITTWVRDRVHLSIGDARKLTTLGSLIDNRDDVADAIHAGDLTCEQALCVGRVVRDLADDCRAGGRARPGSCPSS
jgi:hypothetical protein